MLGRHSRWNPWLPYSFFQPGVSGGPVAPPPFLAPVTALRVEQTCCRRIGGRELPGWGVVFINLDSAAPRAGHSFVSGHRRGSSGASAGSAFPVSARPPGPARAAPGPPRGGGGPGLPDPPSPPRGGAAAAAGGDSCQPRRRGGAGTAGSCVHWGLRGGPAPGDVPGRSLSGSSSPPAR